MINEVILTGRLTAHPELKTTPSGVEVTSFTIANDVGYGDSKKTSFINIVAWRKTAEFVTKYFTKGDAIGVIGDIQTRSYEDKEGKKRTAFEVVAREVQFMESKKDSVQSGESVPEDQNKPNFVELGDDEELPF